MTKIYELYQCEYKGEIVYIGQGKKGRHKHCNSGCMKDDNYYALLCRALTDLYGIDLKSCLHKRSSKNVL